MAALTPITHDALRDRLVSLTSFDELLTAPVSGGTYLFFTRTPHGEKHVELFVRSKKEEHALIASDPSEPRELITWVASLDGKKVAYEEKSHDGDVIYVVDTVSAHRDSDIVRGAKWPAAWSATGFFYAKDDQQLMHHVLGTAQSRDTLVFRAPTDARIVTMTADAHRQALTLVHADMTTDLLYREAKVRDFHPLLTRARVESVSARDDEFYVQLSDHGSHVVRVTPDQKEPQELVPATSRAQLVGATVAGDFLVLHYQRDGASQLELRRSNGTWVRNLPLPDLGTITDMHADSADTLYCVYTGFTQPPEILAINVKTAATKTWATTVLPINGSPYLTEQLAYTTHAGAAATMFLVHRADMVTDGETPFVILAAEDAAPRFQPYLDPWLQAGGAYAITSDDAAAAQAWLIDNRYASAARSGLIAHPPQSLDAWVDTLAALFHAAQ